MKYPGTTLVGPGLQAPMALLRAWERNWVVEIPIIVWKLV